MYRERECQWIYCWRILQSDISAVMQVDENTYSNNCCNLSDIFPNFANPSAWVQKVIDSNKWHTAHSARTVRNQPCIPSKRLAGPETGLWLYSQSSKAAVCRIMILHSNERGVVSFIGRNKNVSFREKLSTRLAALATYTFTNCWKSTSPNVTSPACLQVSHHIR